MTLLTERYAKLIKGVISCYDRIIVTGTLTGVCHPQGMTSYLYGRGIRVFDFAQFAKSLNNEIQDNAKKLAKENSLEIEYIRSNRGYRKDERIAAILAVRGEHPGLVHIFSSLEPCSTFSPWCDRPTGKSYLRPKDSKCLHYYFYFIDELFGLCYLRVSTWAPFRLQFYCNGHNYLISQLKEAGIDFQQLDNTFASMADFDRAQAIADAFPVKTLHERLDQWAVRFCPAVSHFADLHPDPYHWSIMQAEYATDIIFHRQEDLRHLYEPLVHTAIHAVKVDSVATFLGKKLHPLYQGDVGNNFDTRIEGTRIKHRMGSAAIKMYDKLGLVLRIETTVNDVSFFKHYREVEHRNGTTDKKLAPMQKTIYSLPALRELLVAANRRYLAFLSELVDPSAGIDRLKRLSGPIHHNERTYRGFNLFDKADHHLFCALAQGQWHITGFKNSTLRRLLPDKTGPQLSRMLQRLHMLRIIRKASHAYKYYLTKFGQQVVLTALKLRDLVVIPSLAGLA
jgi:hypothetical protein